MNDEKWTEEDKWLVQSDPTLRKLYEKAKEKEKLFSKFDAAEESAWEAASERRSLSEFLPTDSIMERDSFLAMEEDTGDQIQGDADLELADVGYHTRRERRKAQEGGLHESLSFRAQRDLELDPESLDQMEKDFPPEIDVPDPKPPGPSPPLTDRDQALIRGDEALGFLHDTVRHATAMDSKLRDLEDRQREAMNATAPEYGKSGQPGGSNNYKDSPGPSAVTEPGEAAGERFEMLISETSARKELAGQRLVHARRAAWASSGWSPLSLNAQSYLSGPSSRGGGLGRGLGQET